MFVDRRDCYLLDFPRPGFAASPRRELLEMWFPVYGYRGALWRSASSYCSNWAATVPKARCPKLRALILIAVLASIGYVAVNQACVAALGYRGRALSVILLCLQITSTGATFPVETPLGSSSSSARCSP